MIYLVIVSLLWAFSFGLIKTNLSNIDSNFVAFARLFISLLVFLPFLRFKNIKSDFVIKLIGIGALQYGIMYISYIYAYRYLEAYEIALFTIFTPLYVTLINDLLNKKINITFLSAALLAVTGAAVLLFKDLSSSAYITGFILMQFSNICFAGGQIFYKRLKSQEPGKSNVSLFALLYLGAASVALLAASLSTDFSELRVTGEQFYTLLYLGAVASGLSFFLWNVGATMVNEGALAVFNNLKIPLAVAVSLIIFGETGDWFKLIAGGSIIIAAMIINEVMIKRKEG